MGTFVVDGEIRDKLNKLVEFTEEVNSKLITKIKSKNKSFTEVELRDSIKELLTLVEDGGEDWVSFCNIIRTIYFGLNFDAFGVEISSQFEKRKILCLDFKLVLEGSISVCYNNFEDGEKSDRPLIYNFDTSINLGLTKEDWLSNKKYEDDIRIIYDILVAEPLNSDYNEAVLEDIRNGDVKIVADSYRLITSAIHEVYKALYENVFSLHPYVGAFTFLDNKKYNFVVPKDGVTNEELYDNNGVLIKDKVALSQNFMKVSCLIKKEETLASNGYVSYVSPDQRLEETYPKYLELCNNISSLADMSSSSISTSRGFDIDDILESSKIKYYPFECFGFAIGAEPVFDTKHKHEEEDTVTVNAKSKNMIYKKSSYNNWKDYSNTLVFRYLDDLFVRYIYKSLEKHCVKDNKPVNFKSEEFLNTYKYISPKAGVYNIFTPLEVYHKDVLADMVKFMKTVCSAYILTRADNDAIFGIKVCDYNTNLDNFKFSLKSSYLLYKGDSLCDGKDKSTLVFKDGIDCGGSIIRSGDEESTYFKVFEYFYASDQELVDAKPLWGYQAAKLFQETGQPIDKENILLGENMAGVPVFSSAGSGVNLQGNLFHRIVAGSRSGKGLITMNVLASMLASDAAVFYIDNKPDMAGEFITICGGDDKMFCVNGGDQNSDNDVHHTYSGTKRSSVLYQRFRNKLPSIQKLKQFECLNFSEVQDWASAVGNFVYLKAAIFALGIVWARITLEDILSEYRQNAEEDLDFEHNVVVVCDELTAWHRDFESKFMATKPGTKPDGIYKYYDPTFGASIDSTDTFDFEEAENNLLDDKMKDLHNLKSRYEEAKLARNGSKEAESAYEKAQNAYQKVLNSVKKSSKDKMSSDGSTLATTLYWTTLIDKYRDFIIGEDAGGGTLKGTASYLTKKGSKFKDVMMNNDVYYIGQYITGVANTGEPYRLTNAKEIVKSGINYDVEKHLNENDDCNSSYMFGFAESISCDWIVGKNIKNFDTKIPENMEARPDFGGSQLLENGATAQFDWIHTRGNWMYIPSGKQETYRNQAPNWDSVAFIKPYVVLNTNEELTSLGSDSGNGNKSPYCKEGDSLSAGKSSKYIFGSASRIYGKNFDPAGVELWEKMRLEWVKPQPDGKKPSKNNPCYGQLEDGIGLKGLITEYKRTNAGMGNVDFDPTWLHRSGDIANKVCRKFGYKDYIEYLLDFSPKGIICGTDIIRLYTNPELQCTWNGDTPVDPNKNERLRRMFPRYYRTNSMNILTDNFDESSYESEEGADEVEDIETVIGGIEPKVTVDESSNIVLPETETEVEDEPVPETVADVFSRAFDDDDAYNYNSDSSADSDSDSQDDWSDEEDDWTDEEADLDDEEDIYSSDSINLAYSEDAKQAYIEEGRKKGFAEAFSKIQFIVKAYVELGMSMDENTKNLNPDSEEYKTCFNTLVNEIMNAVMSEEDI